MVYRTYREVTPSHPVRYMYKAERVYRVSGNTATVVKDRVGRISEFEISPENVALLIKLVQED